MSAYWHIKALMIYEGQIGGHQILGFTWACFCSTRSSVYIHTGERKKSCLTKYLYWLFLDEKIMGFYTFFSIFAKIYIIRCCFYQRKNGGYKNRIDKDNLEGSQLCATCKRFHLKISRKHNSLQILRASGCFLPSSPALHIESVFSSCWMVKFITSLPACFCNLPSVFLLTCWGFTKTLVLSKRGAWEQRRGRHGIFIAFLLFSFLRVLLVLSASTPAGPGARPHSQPSVSPQSHALTVTVTAAVLVVIYLCKLPNRSW